MKKAIIICMIFIGANMVHAQTVASPGQWEENNSSIRKVKPLEANEFMNTEISVDKGKVTFTELPELKKATWAILTNANGDVITQKRITLESNTVDIRRLSKGEMYFVTLIYKNKSKKGFVLHL